MQRESIQQRALRSALAFAVAMLLVGSLGCTPRAMRGGEGTANPDLDRRALSVTLDRDDITYLVADYLERLEASPFWQQTVKGAATPPVVAIWPIQNATTQHLDDQMLTLLSSIETQRKSREQRTPPLLPPPLASRGSAAGAL